MPQLSSGKDKLVEVRVARICPSQWQEPFWLRCRVEKRIKQNRKVRATRNWRSGQVARSFLKSKWPESVPAGGWRPFSFVVGWRKNRLNKKVESGQQLPQWSSGKCKVFEVYVARICRCQWLEAF